MKYLLTGAILLVFTVIATAADLPSAPPMQPAPRVVAPAAYNWSGFYIGVMGGGGWSTSQGVDFKGGFAGGTVGYNAQFSNFVIGGELEGAWSNIGETAVNPFFGITATDQVKSFGSATVRAGFAVNNALFYGKGGFAAANNNITLSGPGATITDTQTHTGYTVGAGIEYGFTPNWSVKGEYLWAHYSSKNYFATIVPPGAPSGELDVNTLKFGFNYRFGWGGPVVANY